MPFLDTDTTDTKSAPMEVSDNYRPRSGSFGLKNIFKKRHKSGDPTAMAEGRVDMNNGDGSPQGSKDPSPASTPMTGKKKNSFLEAFRPRSRSDAASQVVLRHRSATIDTPMPVSGSSRNDPRRGEHDLNFAKSPSTDNRLTPMSNLLSPNAKSKHISDDRNGRSSNFGPEDFIEMYRSRAYSDPRPRARAAALAAARRKRVSH